MYKYTRNISNEEVNDIMTTALEGGITYWCGEARVKSSGNKDDVEYISEEVANGGVIELYDFEEDKWHEFGIEQFLKGLAMRTSFDINNYDSLDADAIVQYGIFGELVYA